MVGMLLVLKSQDFGQLVDARDAFDSASLCDHNVTWPSNSIAKLLKLLP
jgi:hypothetical protein